MRHILTCLMYTLRHPVIAFKGAQEFRLSCGMTYDDDPESSRSQSYDSGRELAHIVTLRRYELW